MMISDGRSSAARASSSAKSSVCISASWVSSTSNASSPASERGVSPARSVPRERNDRAKVRQFIGILRGLALRQRCAVMLLGHPSVTGLDSGTGTSG
jgi:hypothetical protein